MKKLFCKIFGHKYKMLKPEVVKMSNVGGVYDLTFKCKVCGNIREVFNYHPKDAEEDHYFFTEFDLKKNRDDWR